MYLLDSNIIIDFLNGDKKVGEWMNQKNSNTDSLALSISVIGKIEVLSGKNITEAQVMELEKFLDTFYNIPLDEEVVRLAAMLRREKVLTLGDAIVAATAITRKRTLVTRDKSLSNKVKSLVEVIPI
jgi:predicted nucleic acid-binding protein